MALMQTSFNLIAEKRSDRLTVSYALLIAIAVRMRADDRLTAKGPASSRSRAKVCVPKRRRGNGLHQRGRMDETAVLPALQKRRHPAEDAMPWVTCLQGRRGARRQALGFSTHP